MAIVDYENRKRDGMLKRLAARYVERPHPIPTECIRHLPYAKTLAIFAAQEEKRAERMREYLADWYAASRDEPYHGAHVGNRFLGYWSSEAAAITVVLEIDDGAYSNARYYPRDRAGFGRKIAKDGEEEAIAVPAECRARAGENCPLDGRWESIGVPTERGHYKHDVELRGLGSPQGLTVWRFIRE